MKVFELFNLVSSDFTDRREDVAVDGNMLL